MWRQKDGIGQSGWACRTGSARQGTARNDRQPARQCAERGRARRLAGRDRGGGRGAGRRGCRHRGRRKQFYRWRRYSRVRPTAEAPVTARGLQSHRKLHEARRGRDPRCGARRRARSCTRLALPSRARGRKARFARSSTGLAAWCGRHTAFATIDRRPGGARSHAHWPPHRGEGSARAGSH